VETKICTKCKKEKPLTEFYEDTRNVDNLVSHCKLCYQNYRDQHKEQRSKDLKIKYKNNPELKKLASLRFSYNITLDEFKVLLHKQNNSCKICGSLNSGWKNDWCVDHDHSCCSTGKSCGKCIRGLLCHPCNVGLGYFRDNSVLLRKAADYLDNYEEKSDDKKQI
jgi:hypothetical protein